MMIINEEVICILHTDPTLIKASVDQVSDVFVGTIYKKKARIHQTNNKYQQLYIHRLVNVDPRG